MIQYVIFAAAVLGTSVAILAWQRPRRRHNDEIRAIELWLERFSADSYRPMLRLADGRDASFLGVHRGSEEAARYSRLQRRMLKEYLRGLSRDFHRLHILATDSALRVEPKRAASSLTLVEEKMEFIFSVWSVELRLLLNEVAPCVINLQPVLANVEQLTVKTREVCRRRIQFRVS